MATLKVQVQHVRGQVNKITYQWTTSLRCLHIENTTFMYAYWEESLKTVFFFRTTSLPHTSGCVCIESIHVYCYSIDRCYYQAFVKVYQACSNAFKDGYKNARLQQY